MSTTTTTTTTTTTHERGDRYGPIEWAQLESRAYRVALFADGRTDGRTDTHDDGMYRA